MTMKAQFTYWQEKDGWLLGYLNDYPDHWTQGEDLEDLKEHLRALHEMFSASQSGSAQSRCALILTFSNGSSTRGEATRPGSTQC